MSEPFPFIVARARSGTTLLRAILKAHPDLEIPGESTMISKFGPRRRRYETSDGFRTGALASDLVRDDAFRRWHVDDRFVERALLSSRPGSFPDAVRALYSSYARLHGKSRYGDKAASHVTTIDKIAVLLPEARFVHLIRDGRDAALSFVEAEFGGRSVEDAAARWRREVEKGRRLGRRLGSDRYLEVRYEELLAEPRATVERVCRFIELPFHPDMLRYHERPEDTIEGLAHAGEHQNLRLPPTVGLRDWRSEMSGRDVARVEAVCGRLLSKLGYERATKGATPRDRSSALVARARTAGQDVARELRHRRRAAEATRSDRPRSGSTRISESISGEEPR